MRNESRDAARIKRGRGAGNFLPFDELTIEPEPILDAAHMTAEQLFDLAWYDTVVGEALRLLEHRTRTEGRGAVFEVFRRYHMVGESAEKSYAEIGRELSFTAPQVKHALIEMRAAFRDAVIEVIRGYVEDPAELEVELRRLIGGG
jgi:hypothetical protein